MSNTSDTAQDASLDHPQVVGRHAHEFSSAQCTGTLTHKLSNQIPLSRIHFSAGPVEFQTFRVQLFKLCFRQQEKEINAPKRESIALLDATFALRVSSEFLTFQCSVPPSVPLPTARTPWSRPVWHHEHARSVQLKRVLVCPYGDGHGLQRAVTDRSTLRNVHSATGLIEGSVLRRVKINFLLYKQRSSPQTRRCSSSTLHYNPHLSCLNPQTVARSVTQDSPR